MTFCWNVDGGLAREIFGRSTAKLLTAVATSRSGVQEFSKLHPMQIATLLMTEGIPSPRMNRAMATISLDSLVDAPLMLAIKILKYNQRDRFQGDAESSCEVKRRSAMIARTNGTANLCKVI